MYTDGQRTERRRNIAEIFNRLSRAHERYRQTNGRRHIANVKVSSRSLKYTCHSVIWYKTHFEILNLQAWIATVTD